MSTHNADYVAGTTYGGPTTNAEPRPAQHAESVVHGPVPGYLRTRAYRASTPAARERERRRNAARQRALVRLARAHPEEFKALLDEEYAP